MRWVSHVLIAASICAVANPLAVPAAVAGSTAPDWLEMIARPLRGNKIKHRGVTHYLVAWVALALFGLFVWDWMALVFWFAVGGAVHWVCDALTVTGAPVGPWSDRRMTLFGGKVITGGPAEYVITGVVVVVCALLIFTKQTTGGFIPFFFDWGALYEKGVIDGHEWRTNRFNFI